MPKPEKVEAVQALKEKLENSSAALLAEFRGLRVSEMAELRRSLKDSGTELKVVKNTLGRIAAKEANLEDLLPLLEGSTAIAFISGDPVPAAKEIDEISKKYPALVVKGGLLEGKVLDGERAKALAKVKPREVLLAQLAGLMQGPIAQFALLLSAPVRNLGYALTALKDKLPAEPAEESPVVPEAAAAEAAAEPAEESPVVPEAAEPQTEQPNPASDAPEQEEEK
ncbi:MAG: 50S ribosomal protein L10 [Actinomycetota bacterium]